MKVKQFSKLTESRQLEAKAEKLSTETAAPSWHINGQSNTPPSKLPTLISKLPTLSPHLSPTRIILVRHGRSTFNEQGRYQGSSDEAVLIEKGRQDARQVGSALKGIPIEAVYVSPLRRVQETVLEILDAVGTFPGDASIQVSGELREIDLPAWQGLPFKYVREQLAADYRCWKQRPHEFQMQAIAQEVTGSSDGGAAVEISAQKTTFPVLDLYQRAEQFWREILPRHAGQTLLLVSHGGTNHALISTALGLSPTHHHGLQQSNCGVSTLTFSACAPSLAQLESLNLTTPLGETLPKLKEGKQGLRLLLTPSNLLRDNQDKKLSEFLKGITIDFSLSEALDPSHKVIDQILQYHPSTLHLQMLRHDFPQAWRQTLQTTPGISTQLLTGLVVADSSHIKKMLGQAIGLHADQCWRLQVRPGTLSVVHYPSVNDRPVLQALNIDPNGGYDSAILACE